MFIQQIYLLKDAYREACNTLDNGDLVTAQSYLDNCERRMEVLEPTIALSELADWQDRLQKLKERIRCATPKLLRSATDAVAA